MRIYSFLLPLLGGALLSGVLLAQVPGQQPPPKPPAPNPIGALPPAAPSLPPDKVILIIGDQKMTVAEYDKFLDALPEQYRSAARGAAKRQVVEQLVDVKVMAAEARKRKLDQDPAFKSQMAFQMENLLAGALYRDMSSNLKISDPEVRKYYDEHKNTYEKVSARHILIRFKGSPVPKGSKPELTEEEALAKVKAIRERLVKGEDFATVAKAESDDTGSGSNGGDLNSFGHGQMVAPFDEAAFKLPVGQISEPVKTQFGYHVILVSKHETKPFEEVKGEIETKLRPELA